MLIQVVYLHLDQSINLINYQYFMNKQRLAQTNRDKYPLQQTQQIFSHQLQRQPKVSDKNIEFLLPIEPSCKKQIWGGKIMKSEGKSSERQTKMPFFELLDKDSLLLKKKQSFNIKNLTKKRVSSNRMMTEKLPVNTRSTEKTQSINKILIRGGKTKDFSPNNHVKQNLDSERLNELFVRNQSESLNQSPKKSLDKKLTQFQRKEMRDYEVFYVGPRRVNNFGDFTDSEGDPKVIAGDSIAYKYEIISLLGRGSFGKVYKAYDHQKKEHVALKIIKSQQKFTTQAKVQIQILETALINDPKLRNNVVRLKGSFIFRGHTCLKFQILSKNLYEFLKQTNFLGFSLDLIRRFAIQILQALHFFQKHKIIHCDLKPQNILLKQENKSGIKIIDAGSGCFQGKQIYTYIQSRFYRAPEIILGVKYTTAIDVWSFGCILAELYTGIPIFPGQNENEQMIMFTDLLGLPSKSFLQKAERRKKFFTDEFELRPLTVMNRQKIKESMTWKNILGNDCDKGFLDLMKKCLMWDPSERITPKNALLHDWILAGLPHAIRVQHVQQLKNE